MENAHEAIISNEQFNAAQALRAKRQKQYRNAGFQSRHLLSGILFCGHCGGRYYMRNSGKYYYYACYSRTKQIKSMVKDPNCKNKLWKAVDLEMKIEAQICELLQSPNMLADIASKKPKVIPVSKDVDVEKRIHEIDRQINKLMELYQQDNIPPEILGDKINKLYTEKTTLQASLTPITEVKEMSFDLAEELISNAAQIWEFADKAQKRQIIQSLISKITLTDDNIDIEWSF